MEPIAPERELSNKDYEILKNPRQREVLKRRAVDLVNLSRRKNCSLLFLDRGARPLAYLFSKTFLKLYPQEKKPKIGFLNIGSEKTNHVNKIKKKNPGKELSFNDIFETERIEELRQYLQKSTTKERLIVDDLIDSGDTKNLALDLLRSVDPDNNYEFYTFIKSGVDRDRFTELD